MNIDLKKKKSSKCTIDPESTINKKYLPPPMDQGKCGSCYSFAVAGALTTIDHRYMKCKNDSFFYFYIKPTIFNGLCGAKFLLWNTNRDH